MADPTHLTDISSLSDATFGALLDRSLTFRGMMDRGASPRPSLQHRLQFNLFYENSTRTNLSFEVAAKRLGAIVSVVPVAASSVHKGESKKDTVLTLCAQGADYLVLRATEPGTIADAIAAIHKDGFSTSIINAGEGALGHPTQGLLDAATVLHAKGRTAAQGLADLTLTICGDIRHSRVAVSAIQAFSRLGMTIRLAGPQSLLPDTPPPGVTALVDDLDAAMAGSDIVMALRIQRERMAGEADVINASDAAFNASFGLNHDRLAKANPGALVMHPGPMNRGVEMDDALADDPDLSLIRSQVTQGVALRMAVLEWLESTKE